MAATALDLQKAVFTALTTDVALTDRLGGPRIHDHHAPGELPFPYVSFGRTSLFDWSTSTEGGSEQLFTLQVWSKARGKAEALEIMELVRACLDDQPLAMAEGQLVLMRLEFAEVRRDDDLALYRGSMRFRALVERPA